MMSFVLQPREHPEAARAKAPCQGEIHAKQHQLTAADRTSKLRATVLAFASANRSVSISIVNFTAEAGNL